MRWIISILLVLTLARVGAAEPSAQKPTLDDFLAGADAWQPELSPSGKQLTILQVAQDAGSSHFLSVVNLEDPSLEREIIGFGPFWVNWVEWASEDRLLVGLTGLQDLRTDEIISIHEDLPDRAVPYAFSRILAMDVDGSNAVPLFGDSQRMMRNRWLSSVTSFLPDDPDHIIMPARLRGDLDLFKVNVNDGTHERIGVGNGNTYAWYVDQNGEPAFRFNTNSRRSVIRIYAREDRDNGQIRWRQVRTIRLNRNNENREAATEFRPLAPGADDGTYYVAARPEGENTTAIYLYDFESDEFLETIAKRDDLDIQNALFDSETGDFLGVYYWDHRLVIDLMSGEVQAHIDALNDYFGGQANVVPLDSSKNGKLWLIQANGPTEPGTYHVYDVENAYASEIAYQFSSLIGRQLSPTEVIEYEARDGLAISGYLTRPADAAEGDTPPLIVMPHGGPEVRDYIEFNTQVQYLASLGYQVFQPNFRGSAGFGKEFADLGRRQYGKAMQTDVEDGFHHLVAEGLADADRACIFGYSYGGYVAMASATLTPDLYQCVIAGAGLSDLVKMLQWERREEGRNSEAYEYWLNQIGDPRRDRDELRAVSPALLAERVTAPLLLIHGAADNVVPIEQSKFMEDAMRDAGRPVEFLRLEEAGHSYRPDHEQRLEYETVTAFLAKHLPVETSPPAEVPASYETVEDTQ